jgi:hypothetical protein
MRLIVAGIVVTLMSLIADSSVEAQQPCGGCPAAGGLVISEPLGIGTAMVGQPAVTEGVVAAPWMTSDRLIDVGATSVTPVSSVFPAQGQVLPYSYWVTAPAPARIYVTYGGIDQFPFQGRPYGRPNDRWSWYYMGGGNERYLSKYYFPLLP